MYYMIIITDFSLSQGHTVCQKNAASLNLMVKKGHIIEQFDAPTRFSKLQFN